MEGWIKLHRKILDNPIMRDDNAYKLFTILLMLVDKKTGRYTSGRFRLSDITGINPNTVYATLKRLEKKYEMITQVSNNHFTTISIVNWHHYQGNGNTKDNNQITTRQQPDNTKQELKIKNKEYIYSKKEYLETEEAKSYFYEKFPTLTRKRIDQELEAMLDWIANAGTKGVKSDYQAFGRNWLRKTEPDKKATTDHVPYKPRTNDEFTDLGAIMAARLKEAG